jgi:hypothetical protein
MEYNYTFAILAGLVTVCYLFATFMAERERKQKKQDKEQR